MAIRRSLRTALVTLTTACSCGSDGTPLRGDAGTVVLDPIPLAYDAGGPTGPCAAIEQHYAIEGHNHYPICTKIEYGTNPPSSGNHYGVWAAFKTYTAAIPEGYWVHDLEHGAVVLTYSCPAGCAADVAAAQAMMDAFPDDPLCTELNEGVRHRLVMTPDPKLDLPFAASAWGYTLKAQCFDVATFRSFLERHYGHGPEGLCDDGAQVTDSAATCGN